MATNIYLKLIALCAISVTTTVSASSVTYPGIGTFYSTDFYHLIYRPTTIFFLPEAPEKIAPTFLLYTRNNRESGSELVFNDTASIADSPFNPSLPTKVLMHGFQDMLTTKPWLKEMKDRLLDEDDLNVIIVDWSMGAKGIYGQAVVNARVVGAMVGIEVGLLNEATGASLDSFHLLGHSLGGHVAGYAGKWLNGTLGRITGLDPAGPFFTGLQAEARLWPSDAQFVDVIHTATLFQGTSQSCGHLDFYVNGGVKQPGCIGISDGWFDSLSCDHNRAHSLYIDAINRTVTPIGHQCSSYTKFKRGQCSDCGENDEKCAIFGPRAIESKGKISSTDAFYLDSNRRRPLFD